MKNFHGWNKQHTFFEGWYLKHQVKKRMVAFIPAYHMNEQGKASASIQIITEKKSYTVNYPADVFSVCDNMFWVKIGNNLFTQKGISINIKNKGLTVKGKIRYRHMKPPLWDIMGPFRWLPGMQCNHGVLSFYHELSGELTINGETIDFTGGKGYLEKDWGSSFPDSYYWTQCNWGGSRPGCVMAAVAKIPFMGRSFKGCIAIVRVNGKEYRLATYLGARVQYANSREIIIKQGRYRLMIFHQGKMAVKLSAPNLGSMDHAALEYPRTDVKYQLWKGDKILFEYRSKDASFEKETAS